jgi:hypothetical protein
MRELFEYRDGALFWIKSRTNSVKVGERAGRLKNGGYRIVGVNDGAYMEHRVIYAIIHGIDPGQRFVDHINGKRSDNRIENLRLATFNENCANRSVVPKQSKSGIRGVARVRNSDKWVARVQVNNKQIHGGVFPTADQAALRAKELRKQHFGEFAGI